MKESNLEESQFLITAVIVSIPHHSSHRDAVSKNRKGYDANNTVYITATM